MPTPLPDEPRATKVLDVLVRPDVSNAARVVIALRRFGAPLSHLVIRNKLAAGRPQALADVAAPSR